MFKKLSPYRREIAVLHLEWESKFAALLVTTELNAKKK